MKGKQLRVAGIVLGLLLIAAFAASADWKGSAPAPSSEPWVFDFGQGWFTVQVQGSDYLLLLKKFPPQLENSLYKSGGFGIGGFDVKEKAPGKRLVNPTDQPTATIQLHFNEKLNKISLMSEDGSVKVDIKLVSQTFSEKGFTGSLTRKGDLDFVLVLTSWPPGDPLMGG